MIRQDLIKLARRHPEAKEEVRTILRKLAALKQKTAAFVVWDTLAEGKTPKGKALPRSFWDGPRESSPFTWATPAPNTDGSFPEPWRNPNSERALNWIIRTRILDDIIDSPREIVTDGHPDINGHRVIWLGFRDNRDNTKVELAFAELKRRKVPVKAIKMNGKLSSLLLVDDLPSHPFGG